jgi:hypothetical protein
MAIFWVSSALPGGPSRLSYGPVAGEFVPGHRHQSATYRVKVNARQTFRDSRVIVA